MMMVTDLDHGERYSLDGERLHAFEYDTFKSDKTFHSDSLDIDGLRGMQLGSSTEWINSLQGVDIPAIENDVKDLVLTTPTLRGRAEMATSYWISPFGKPISRRPCLDDYTLLKVLGKGSFGKVLLVRKKSNRKLYAMKILRKEVVHLRRQVGRTKTERLILEEIDSPFVTKLHAAFQCGSMLYLVMDYCPGGELFFHMNRAGIFPENVTRFYAAEIVLALADLHASNIVYRDLKPENVLLDFHGHVCLADFGLCKREVTCATTGCMSLCGTPEYLAPEVLSRTGHGLSVDWWALGMLVFEMMTGLPPWYTKDRLQLVLNLRSAPFSQLAFPNHISAPARDFVLRLLDRTPATRLGTLGPESVQAHHFFEGVDWEELRQKRTPVPIKPCKHMVEGSECTRNFSHKFTRMSLVSIDVRTDKDMLASGLIERSGSVESKIDMDVDKFESTFDGFTCGSQTESYLQP